MSEVENIRIREEQKQEVGAAPQEEQLLRRSSWRSSRQVFDGCVFCVSAHIRSSRSGLQTSLHHQGSGPPGSWSTWVLVHSLTSCCWCLQRHCPTIRVPVLDSDGQSSCATEMVGVLVQPKEPSSLSVMETLFQAGLETEDEVKPSQKVQRRKSKQEQLRRLHRAQVTQAEPLQTGSGPDLG